MGCGCKKNKKETMESKTVDQMIDLKMNESDVEINRFHTHFENAEFIDPNLLEKIEQDEQGE